MGDYIMDMRKRVGHIPLMQCGASVIVENERGEILLQQRSDNGAWGYPGGAVELYERVEDAARRELFEETGLHAGKMELLGVFSGPEMAYTYPNGDQVSNVDIVFVCRSGKANSCASRVRWKRWPFSHRRRCPPPCMRSIILP